MREMFDPQTQIMSNQYGIDAPWIGDQTFDVPSISHANLIANDVGVTPSRSFFLAPTAAFGAISGRGLNADNSNSSRAPKNHPDKPSSTKASKATKVKPRSACPTCKKTFSRQANLARHSNKHRTGKPKFQCAVESCGYGGTWRKDKMRSHMRNCHSNGHDIHGVFKISIDYQDPLTQVFCLPGCGDCKISQDCLISSAFADGEMFFRGNGFVGPCFREALKYILSDDCKSVRKLAKSDYQHLCDLNNLTWLERTERG